MVLWVPEDYAGTLTLSAVSGELSMNSLYAPEMSVSLTTVSGDVDVYDGRIGALSVETVSGDVWIESLKTDTVTASTVSGDIRGSVKGLHGEPKIETYTVSGDVSFE